MRTEDGYIIQQCLDGNPTTFGFLVDKYKSSVYALAYSEIRNFHDAQDITQEVFIKAFQNLHTLKRWDSFMGWLCRITTNTCKNWVRSASRRPESESIDDQTIIGDQSIEYYQRDKAHQSINDALDSLPMMYRQVLTLRYFSGMTVKEISNFLSISPRTVDRRISDAQARLKEEILDIMQTAKKQHGLPANFTFKIVEMVKHIKSYPIPQIKSLPWGFSLALGFVAMVLSIGTHISFEYVANNIASSSIREPSVPKVGEIDVNMIEKTNTYFTPMQKLGSSGLSSIIPDLFSAFFSASQGEQIGSANSDDLVIYLSMDGRSDVEALKNQTNKDVKAVKHGNPKWKSSNGYNGKGAFEFDGNSDISLGDSFPIRSSYTKTVWIYWTGNGGKHAGNNIISGDQNENGHAFWCPEIYGNKLSAGHNTRWNTVQDKEPLQRNRWYFVAVTYDRSSQEMVLYKDAKAVSRAKVANADKDVADPTISIGSFGEKNGWMFQGLIDDVRIYDIALSDNEIKRIFEDKGIVEEKRQEPVKAKNLSDSFIVWESNRTGQWELYRVNIDGSGFWQLAELAKIYPLPYDNYLRPRVSPDGKAVLFGYGKKNAPVEVWVISSEGGQPKKLTTGNPLNWSPDGKLIYFVRNSQIWQYEYKTGKESIIYDKKVPVDGVNGNMVGDIRRDLKAVVLRSEKSNEYFDFDKAETVKTTGGCEPSFSSDGRYMYWVNNPKDFWVWDMKNNEEHQFLGTPDYEAWNYTYFPRVSTDSKWIVYGASPNQHDHNTSDYEIFAQKLDNWKPVGKPIRITNDPHTDRWGTIWMAN